MINDAQVDGAIECIESLGYSVEMDGGDTFYITGPDGELVTMDAIPEDIERYVELLNTYLSQ